MFNGSETVREVAASMCRLAVICHASSHRQGDSSTDAAPPTAPADEKWGATLGSRRHYGSRSRGNFRIHFERHTENR